MMMTKPTTSLPMNLQNVRQKNNSTSLLVTRSIEVKTNNTLSINVSEQTTMNLSCLLKNPSVRRRRKSCNRQSQLWTSSVAPLVFPVILLLCLGSFDQGRRTKSPCYQVHAWLPPSPRQQPLRSHRVGRTRQRRRPLLKLFAYTEETGPRVGSAGYPNQTQPLTSTTALWNGKSQPTPSLSKSQVSVQQPLSKPDVGTLGDIMSSAPSSLGDEEGEEPVFSSLPASLFHHSGLVTSSSRNETLAAKFGITHPLDRMALTANGNLQRLFSSYYDAPVFVHVDYCQARDDKGIVWDRVVHLNVHNQVRVRRGNDT